MTVVSFWVSSFYIPAQELLVVMWLASCLHANQECSCLFIWSEHVNFSINPNKNMSISHVYTYTFSLQVYIEPVWVLTNLDSFWNSIPALFFSIFPLKLKSLGSRLLTYLQASCWLVIATRVHLLPSVYFHLEETFKVVSLWSDYLC